MTVGDTHELGAVHVVATGLTPHLGIDHDGHEQLLGAGGVHLIADDVLDLAQRTPREGQVAVKTRGLLADHTRTQHEAVAGELSLSGILFKRRGIQIGHLHGASLRHGDLLISIASNASIIPANAQESCLAAE